MLETGSKENRENCVKIEASEEGIKALLKFLYYDDLEEAFSSPTIAIELLDLAHFYDVKPLEEAMKKLLGKKEDWMNVDDALNLLLATEGKSGLESLNKRASRLVAA